MPSSIDGRLARLEGQVLDSARQTITEWAVMAIDRLQLTDHERETLAGALRRYVLDRRRRLTPEEQDLWQRVKADPVLWDKWQGWSALARAMTGDPNYGRLD